MAWTTRASAIACMAVAAFSSAAARTAPADACGMPEIPAAESLVRVPFELVDGRVYVQALADGKGPFRFAVDTGASGMARADATLAASLSLPLQGKQANSDGVSTAEADTVRFASLRMRYIAAG